MGPRPGDGAGLREQAVGPRLGDGDGRRKENDRYGKEHIIENIFVSPGKYIQGKGALKNLGEHIGALGNRALVITSQNGRARMAPALEGVEKDGFSLCFSPFHGECSRQEVDRQMEKARQNSCDIVVGAGGGKVIDTAKAAACLLGLPAVIVPTAISSDAPCSALAVLYDEDGGLDFRMPLPKAPDVVLVDSDLIVHSPVKLAVAGMGDALSTYFESRACRRFGGLNIHNGHISQAAGALADLCFQILLRDGRKAILGIQEHICTKAVENVIEANTILSGIGFESGGKAAAHAVNDGLAALPACHGLMHGLKVAFGTLTQLSLENAEESELEKVYGFCYEIGLPVTLGQLGISEGAAENARRAARVACAPGESIYNMPMEVTEDLVCDAILGADAWGRDYLRRKKAGTFQKIHTSSVAELTIEKEKGNG